VVVLGIDADDAFELAGGRRSGVGALALPALLRNPPTLPISSIWVLAFVRMKVKCGGRSAPSLGDFALVRVTTS
jgi:hypothetical protein